MTPDPPDDSLRETMEELERAISEEPKTCTACGQAIPSDAENCPHCGADVSEEPGEVPPPPPPEESSAATESPLAPLSIEAPPEAETPFEEPEIEPPALEEVPEPEPAPPPEVEVEEAPAEAELEEDDAAPAEEEIGQVETFQVARARSLPLPASPGRLWAPVALGAIVYLIAIPVGLAGLVGTVHVAVLMLLGAFAVASGVGLSSTSGRAVEPIARAVVTDYVCPLCGTDVAPDAPECSTCGARLTD